MRGAVGLLLFMLASVAYAQEGEVSLDGAATVWIMVSTALVLFMTIPGLSLFYGGLVRTRNVLSVLMQCFSITCMVSILWIMGLYSLCFSDGGTLNSLIGGLDNVMFGAMSRDTLSMSGIPESSFSMFQLTFAIITPALIAGAFAERMKFTAMLLFTALWSILVYAPVCHWVWGGGWLQALGVLDFAGGIVVHITAGVAALIAALVLGKRRGFPNSPMPPHNLTMTVTGAGMLWVGWFGFNGGSALAADASASMAIMVTHLSAAAGAIAWVSAEWFKFRKPSVLGAVTGMVAGLGTITPASGFVGPAGALVIGIVAGVSCFSATNFIKRRLKIDDSLDVFPVHGVGGILGTLMCGLFASSALGIFSGYQTGMSILSQLKFQLLAVVVVVLFTAVVSYLILKLVDRLIGLRVADEEEMLGLDISLHEETGYNL